MAEEAKLPRLVATYRSFEMASKYTHSIGTRVEESCYESLCRLAEKQRVTLGEFLRQLCAEATLSRPGASVGQQDCLSDSDLLCFASQVEAQQRRSLEGVLRLLTVLWPEHASNIDEVAEAMHHKVFITPTALPAEVALGVALSSYAPFCLSIVALVALQAFPQVAQSDIDQLLGGYSETDIE